MLGLSKLQKEDANEEVEKEKAPNQDKCYEENGLCLVVFE